MLSRSQYFAHVRASTHEDQSIRLPPPHAQNFNTTFTGKYKFDLGEINHPIYGWARAKGEIPRIKPRHERANLTSEDSVGLCTKLRSWVDQYFATGINATYWNELIYATCVFAANINPFHTLDSEEMNIALRTYFWLGHTDDFFELAMREKIPFVKIEKGIDLLMTIFNTDLKEDNGGGDCLEFKRLYLSLANIRQSFEYHNIPIQNLSMFATMLKKNFSAFNWFNIAKFGEKYTEETFRFWRRDVSFFGGIVEVLFVLQKANLPKKIREALPIRRLVDITNSVGGHVNDIFEAKKEYKERRRDTLLNFKVYEKRTTVDIAVEEICDLLKDELKDYLLLRDTIMELFEWDANLVTYIDTIEAVLEGHNKFYLQTRRHFIAGHMELVD